MHAPPLSLKRGGGKIRLFKFTLEGGRARALCWAVANFLKWNVWGMRKEWIRVGFQIGPLRVIDRRETIDWRGLETIWDNCSLGSGTRKRITASENKNTIQEVARLSCNTRGRQGLPLFILHPASLTRIWSPEAYIINVSQMAGGLASSVPSDAYLKSVCNFLMFSGCALIKPSP